LKGKKNPTFPQQPVELSEEEKELRILGIRFGRIIRDLEILERELPTFHEHITDTAVYIQKLQQQAEAKRLEKQIEQKKEK